MSWRWSDRLVLVSRGSPALLLCVLAAAIVLYMGYRGHPVPAPRPDLQPSAAEHRTVRHRGLPRPAAGHADPDLIGIALALPLSIVCAVWMTEYGRPSWLARVVESSIEIVAGTPDIVIAIFGLAVFQLPLLAPFSFTSEGGGVYGRSFIAAGAMMSLLALPPLYAATRDGLQAVPGHMREAAFALGKTRITTIRRVLLPNVRSNIATGATLGISRIIGSTAIVLILLGGFLRIETAGIGAGAQRAARHRLHAHELHLLQLPAGEGGAPQKAYAAAFLLLIFVLVLNLVVERIGRAHASRSGLAAGVV